MARLPETDNEEIMTGETADTPASGHRFAAGFLLGLMSALLCITVFMLGWSYAQRKASGTAEEVQGVSVLTDSETLYKLNEVQALIEQHYLNDVDSSLLSSYLFKGIAAGLEDPYANYYSVEELQSVLDSSRGEYFGIGATLMADIRTNEISVLEVYEEGPAFRAGLQPGDVLMSLNDTSLAGSGLSEAVSMIKACDGPFTLGIYRPETEEELQLAMECEEVKLEYVQSEMLENHIGYIRLSEFTESAVGQFREAAEVLKEQGMEKLIVDLRSNPGGLLDSVCDILDEVLPEGLIVYTEDRSGNRQERFADDKRSITCEIAVLVNGNSASASEIFAGAVQDLELGPIIGTKTYGKGVVQQTYTLSDGSAFKLTTETYYTPKGQDINGSGITPDIVVEEPESAGQGSPASEGESTAGEDSAKETDTVLEKAVEVLSTDEAAGE
ncbi:MAG: S41 family peptidase [Lachnospiraceae bacterium]|nr:S41 family peptidase [Lachnospiraceae bacterium]